MPLSLPVRNALTAGMSLSLNRSVSKATDVKFDGSSFLLCVVHMTEQDGGLSLQLFQKGSVWHLSADELLTGPSGCAGGGQLDITCHHGLYHEVLPTLQGRADLVFAPNAGRLGAGGLSGHL